jgi:basic membrane lipoprotein Med (substrate-binding protein (PBP1-ABC) superfamily)
MQDDTGDEKATIYINNGAIQCESEGMSAQQTAQQLIDNGIDVVMSNCGSLTGVAVPTACGQGDIYINLHVINAQNLPDAQELGFETVSSLKTEEGVGYMILGCED